MVGGVCLWTWLGSGDEGDPTAGWHKQGFWTQDWSLNPSYF